MSDLAAFWNARLDEDEAAVQIAAVDDAWATLRETLPRIGLLQRNFDPARALRDVAADRQLLWAYEDACRWHQPYPDDLDDGRREGLETAVKIRAVVYSDHPDYRQEWAP